jgi:hypothetical protein
MSEPIFLTVRGQTRPETIDGARILHNQTAGSKEGVAAARALGDLSHKVYVPVPTPQSSAKPGELLFHDVWESPEGLMQFFGNAHVQEQGGRMFSARDATVWMPARGAFGFNLPAPARRSERLVGMIRGKIASPEKAIDAFRAATAKHVRDARRRGQISHQLYIKMNPPGDSSPVELLGVDLWFDADGMREHYSSMDMGALAPVFSAAPDATIWQEAPGEWNEW